MNRHILIFACEITTVVALSLTVLVLFVCMIINCTKGNLSHEKLHLNIWHLVLRSCELGFTGLGFCLSSERTKAAVVCIAVSFNVVSEVNL